MSEKYKRITEEGDILTIEAEGMIRPLVIKKIPETYNNLKQINEKLEPWVLLDTYT